MFNADLVYVCVCVCVVGDNGVISHSAEFVASRSASCTRLDLWSDGEHSRPSETNEANTTNRTFISACSSVLYVSEKRYALAF